MALRRRAELIERIEAEAAVKGGGASVTCFEILYGLPAEVQLALAVEAMRRYLPLHEQAHPDNRDARRALDDVAAWHRGHGRAVPLAETEAFADAAFVMAFDGLLLAYAFQDDAYTLTAGCAYAIRMAIDAQADTAWIADAPEVTNPFDSAAWIAVRVREWRVVAAALRRPEVLDADDADPDAVAAMRARWLDREEIITVPGVTGPPEAPLDWAAIDARVEARIAAGDPTPIEQILHEELARGHDGT